MLKLASFIGVSLVLLAGLGVGCASSAVQEQGKASASPAPSLSQSPKNGLIQTSSGGGVDIEVEWRGLKDNSMVFGVTMDTHSGSLDQYDLRDLATLRDSRGNEYRPGSPDVPLGGHHRSGLLTFPISEPSNLGTVKSFELILRDIAGVAERNLRWELN
ncbi:MAG: hypothetical protein Q7K41_01275 [Dehalococcoidales bacterium]|nr:hypothetical protein [Dehalococcoidales bacterium]